MNTEKASLEPAEDSLSLTPYSKEEQELAKIEETNNLITEISLAEGKDTTGLIQQLAEKKPTGDSLAKALEPRERKPDEQNLPVLGIRGNVKKITNLCIKLTKDGSPQAKKIFPSINSFLDKTTSSAIKEVTTWNREDLTPEQKKAIRYSSDDPYGSAIVRKIIYEVCEKCNEVPFAVGLLIKTKVDADKIFPYLTKDQKANIINSLLYPFDATPAPQKYLKSSGRKEQGSELMRKVLETYTTPEADDEEFVEIIEEILSKDIRNNNDKIIRLTQKILETKSYESYRWQEILKSAGQNVKIEELDSFRWKITFPDITESIVQSEGTTER